MLKTKEIELRKLVIRSRRVAATVDERSGAAAREFAAQSALGVDSKGQISLVFRRNRPRLLAATGDENNYEQR